MNERRDTTILITIRARLDPSFPDDVFLTARRFVVPEPDPLDEIRSASIEEVLASVNTWLRTQSAS